MGSRLLSAILSTLIMICLAPSASAAAAGDYVVDFGPLVGGGSTSSSADVRHTSGYQLSFERSFNVLPSLSIGPRVQVANTFVNIRDNVANDTTLTGSYDNRIFAAGFTLTQQVGAPHTFAQAIYLSAVAGQGYSKLALDRTRDDAFVQTLYRGIQGPYYSGEVGAWVPLKGGFGINIAFMTDLYEADQSAAAFTSQGDFYDANGELQLTSSSGPAGSATDISEKIVLRSHAARFGIVLGF